MERKVLQYSLRSIKKLTSYINSRDTLPINEIKEDKGVRKVFHFNFNDESGVFTLKITIDFVSSSDPQDPIKLFGTSVQYDFIFKDFEGIVKVVNDSRVDIPDDLLITLMSICYSTTRGILAMLTLGTDYQDVFLPVINVQDFGAMLRQNRKPSSKVTLQ